MTTVRYLPFWHGDVNSWSRSMSPGSVAIVDSCRQLVVEGYGQ